MHDLKISLEAGGASDAGSSVAGRCEPSGVVSHVTIKQLLKPFLKPWVVSVGDYSVGGKFVVKLGQIRIRDVNGNEPFRDKLVSAGDVTAAAERRGGNEVIFAAYVGGVQSGKEVAVVVRGQQEKNRSDSALLTQHVHSVAGVKAVGRHNADACLGCQTTEQRNIVFIVSIRGVDDLCVFPVVVFHDHDDGTELIFDSRHCLQVVLVPAPAQTKNITVCLSLNAIRTILKLKSNTSMYIPLNAVIMETKCLFDYHRKCNQ